MQQIYNGNTWSRTDNGQKLLKVRNNIIKLTQKLKKWNKSTFGNLKRQLIKNKQTLNRLYQKKYNRRDKKRNRKD